MGHARRLEWSGELLTKEDGSINNTPVFVLAVVQGKKGESIPSVILYTNRRLLFRQPLGYQAARSHQTSHSDKRQLEHPGIAEYTKYEW